MNHADPRYKRLLYYFNYKEICDHICQGINTHLNTRDHIKPVFNYYNPFGSTKYVHGNTTKEVFETTKSHVNFVVADTKSWEQICAKSLEEMDQVTSYVKNSFLGFTIPYVKDGKDSFYFPDFIARCTTRSGNKVNLIIEVTGMNRDKAEKKWYVEKKWLPAINSVLEKHGYDEWNFVEIANDIRNIKNELIAKINSL